MKTKKVIIIFACVLLGAFVLGAADIARMASPETGEESLAADDRLIGVLITREYLDLFDMESYFRDNADELFSGGEISEAESAAYEGRLYATLSEKPYINEETGETVMQQEYVFEGVEGVSYFCASYTDGENSYQGGSGDDAIADGHMGISSTDAGDSITLQGTVYISTKGGPTAFYYNPIYQTARGEVYAASGNGMSYGGDIVPGMSGSHSINEKKTVINNGETEEVGTDITISVCYIEPPLGVTVLQLDGESRVLSKEDYAPGELPDTLTAEAGAEYIIVETHSVGSDGGDTATRELFQRPDETLYAFYCRDDGICVKQYYSLSWDD